MTDPIDMTEVEPGKWVTGSQARAHRTVRDALNNSDFTSRKWKFEQKVRSLPILLRIGIFLLICAAAIGFLLGPFKLIAERIFHS